MSLNTTVIGGVQSGWKVAVAVRLKSAFPFWTGKLPAAETLVLFAAFGWCSPGLMHEAVALRTTWIWDSSPRPASLPVTVIDVPDLVTVNALEMKCGLPASAAGTAMPAATVRTSRIFVSRDTVCSSSRFSGPERAGSHRVRERRKLRSFVRAAQSAD